MSGVLDPGWANRQLLLRAHETLSDRAEARLRDVFATDDPTGQLQAVWEAKEQLRTLLSSGSLDEAWDHLRILEGLIDTGVEAAPAHREALVERDRGPHHHRRHHSEGRGEQHRHQEHQTDRPRVPQRRQLPIAYPAQERRSDSSVTLTQQDHSRGNAKSRRTRP